MFSNQQIKKWFISKVSTYKFELNKKMSEPGYSGFTGYSGFYIKSVWFLVCYSDYKVIDYRITHHEHPIILAILI